MPFPCREPVVALRGRFQNGIFVAWQENGMACVNQTRSHSVNQMGKTQSKPLAERHGMCESALTVQADRSGRAVCGRSLVGNAGFNLARAWMSGSCECCVVGSGLFVWLITHPEEFYRVWCVQRVWSPSHVGGDHDPESVEAPQEKKVTSSSLLYRIMAFSSDEQNVALISTECGPRCNFTNTKNKYKIWRMVVLSPWVQNVLHKYVMLLAMPHAFHIKIHFQSLLGKCNANKIIYLWPSQITQDVL
jgi:hypothetical protein